MAHCHAVFCRRYRQQKTRSKPVTALAIVVKAALSVERRQRLHPSAQLPPQNQTAVHRPSVLRAHAGHEPVTVCAGALLGAASRGLAGPFAFGGAALTVTGNAACWGLSSPAFVTSATACT